MTPDGGAKARTSVWMTAVRMAVRKRLAAEDAFTLAEMVVVMGILAIVLGALTTLFVGGMRVQAYMSNRFQSQQNARLALDKLRHEIHCASAVLTTTFPSSTVTFTVGGYCPTADGTKLSSSFTIPPSGTYTIPVPSTAAIPAPSESPPTIKVYVGNSGRIECTGPATGTTIPGCSGGAAGTYPGG